jgi:hypothetical protein
LLVVDGVLPVCRLHVHDFDALTGHTNPVCSDIHLVMASTTSTPSTSSTEGVRLAGVIDIWCQADAVCFDVSPSLSLPSS